MLLPAARSATFWFTDIRKIALTICIASVLVALMAGWNVTQTIFATQWRHSPWWIIAITVPVFVFAAPIMPVFYFALYRNEGTLRFPKRLRLLSLTAALALGIIVAVSIPKWIGSLGSYWTAMKTLDWRIGATTALIAARDHVSGLVGQFFSFAHILLLIAFFRSGSDERHTDFPVSRLLGFATRVSVIALGLFIIVQGGLISYAYLQLRHQALQIGQTPPPLGSSEAARALYAAVALFIAPYIVYKSKRGPRRSVAA